MAHKNLHILQFSFHISIIIPLSRTKFPFTIFRIRSYRFKKSYNSLISIKYSLTTNRANICTYKSMMIFTFINTSIKSEIDNTRQCNLIKQTLLKISRLILNLFLLKELLLFFVRRTIIIMKKMRSLYTMIFTFINTSIKSEIDNTRQCNLIKHIPSYM